MEKDGQTHKQMSKNAKNLYKSEFDCGTVYSTLSEKLENLKNEYTNIWLNTRDIKDTQIREDLHRSLLLLPEVERHLRIMVEKGKLTKTHINKIRNIG
mgnify:CR=1 FL=1